MDELNKIQYALEQHKVCRDTPQQKAAICKRLNNLSQKIKNKLGAFRNKHRDSFPYYVSKDAFDFTFNLFPSSMSPSLSISIKKSIERSSRIK